MKLGFRILAYTLLPLFGAAFIVGDVFAHQYAGLITAALSGNTTSFEGDEVEYACQMGDALGREIEEEGIVLLKNGELSDGTKSLPLDSSVTKVNVFGWGATQFLQRGVGSGSSDINKERSVNFLEALEKYGISYNKNITNAYARFNTTDITQKNKTADYNLYQPTLNWHQNFIAEAKTYSDTALLVIHRVGGENIGEIPVSQTLVTESGQTTDNTRTYLQTTKHEDDLINLLSNNFSNVVLILNTTNPMHLTCLESEKIDSCISVGITGQSGAVSIPHILWGKSSLNDLYRLVSPSGKLTDIISYSPETSPSFANYKHANNHIQYLEDIYYGYRWYETADIEGYWSGVSNAYGTGYDGVVQFPFGFGLSYTTFEWKNMQTSVSTGNEVDNTTSVTVRVTVKNTGNYPGKDVVQLYVSPSYQTGGIEKPSIMLVDFAKTKVLNPGNEDVVELHFDLYDVASYDCYDDNNNGFKGYEVDYGSDGKYVIKLMTDSHHAKEISGGNSHTLNIPQAGIKFENDMVTNHEVSNRMTGNDAYAGVPIDGSNVGAETNYLSRANFASLFPNSHAKTPGNDGSGTNKGPNYYCNFYETSEMPNRNPVDSGLRIATLEDGSFATLEQLSGKTDAKIVANDALIKDLDNYYSQTWNKLLDQISIDDMCDLVLNGGFKTYPIDSIGKPRAFDTDGPAGFNLNTVSMDDGDGSGAKWTAYPSETVIGQTWNKELAEKMGLCMGMEAQATKVQGWYAPGVNLHRTPYTARNYEYYSEDPILSGIFAAKVIDGARTNGLYCYLKHFVLSEPGPNPRKLNTWVTEQNLRENYLKPFEIAVKKGHATAIMSAFNRVGSTWAGASYPCLTQILRNEWGFRGSVITDYAGTGDIAEGNMNPNQGVRAGNNLWLNPATYNDNALNRNDPTTINAVRQSVKGILYSYIDAYYYGSTTVAAYDGYNAAVSMSITAEGNAWWVPLLIGIEVGVMLLLGTYFGFALASGIKIYIGKHPKGERVKREPKPLYITKRMKKFIMWFMIAGGTTALLLVTLVPLFGDILNNQTGGSSTFIPVDTGEVFTTKFEFEEGVVEGNSANEDHLCIADSYFFNMNLSNNGALTNLSEETTISFRFVSSKSYRISLNLRMASVYDETQDKWVEANLKDYLSLTINGKEVDLDNFKIPASSKAGKLEGYDGNDMNMVNVIGIPVTLSNISNNYAFILKEGCPALDYFTIHTSAIIDDFQKSEQVLAIGANSKVTIVPTSIKEGEISISCPNEGCEEVNEYSLPILTGKSWYTYDDINNAYTLDVYGRKYVITPDTAESIIGPIHSECKVRNNFKGENFFQADNWNWRSSTSQNLEDRTYSIGDIIDGEGNVVLTDKTYAKTGLFYYDKQSRKCLTDWATASTNGASYLGKTAQYSFLVNANGGFTFTAFGSTYSDAKMLAKNSVPGIFFRFGSDGRVYLTIGTDAGSPAKEEKKYFRTSVDFISAPSAFTLNTDLWIKLVFSRVTPEQFWLSLYVNDQKVEFPLMDSGSSTGNIANRYTENGNLYIIQDETVNHTWGEFVAVSPDTNTTLIFKDLDYSVI